MSKIKVYATCFWEDDISLLENLRKYGFGSCCWKNIEFTVDKSFDIAVILTAPWKEHLDFAQNKAVRFLTEPPISPHHKDVADTTCPMYLPLPWWVHSRSNVKNIGSLTNKPKLISAITSELYYLEGHIKRINFLRVFDKCVDGDLDIFGRCHHGAILPKMKHYKGELEDKYDGIIPTQYHIASENSFIPNYFTEKILDPICAESLCFYSGCTNIFDFIDHRAYILLDLDNINESIIKVIDSINGSEYEKRLPYILREKRRILYELNPLNIISAQLNEHDVLNYFKL